VYDPYGSLGVRVILPLFEHTLDDVNVRVLLAHVIVSPLAGGVETPETAPSLTFTPSFATPVRPEYVTGWLWYTLLNRFVAVKFRKIVSFVLT
jgi:hypothetical protein